MMPIRRSDPPPRLAPCCCWVEGVKKYERAYLPAAGGALRLSVLRIPEADPILFMGLSRLSRPQPQPTHRTASQTVGRGWRRRGAGTSFDSHALRGPK